MSARLQLAFAALLLVGCDAALGIELLPAGTPDTGTPADTSPPRFTYASPPCGQCVASSCKAAEQACLGNAACTQTFACTAACAPRDLRCRTTCETSLPAGATAEPFRKVDECRRTACTNECYDGGGYGDRFGPACSSCLDSQCLSQATACVRSPIEELATQVGDCDRLVGCYLSAGELNPDRGFECRVRYPGSNAPTFSAFGTCVQGVTCAECDGIAHGNYRCVDGYRWQKSPAGPVRIDLTVTDLRLKELPKMRVRACLGLDCKTCEKFADEDTTDDTGLAKLSLPPGLAFTGCFEVVADGWVPTLVYLGRPLTRIEGALTGVFSHADLTNASAIAGVTPDPELGFVIFGTYDCGILSAARMQVDPIGDARTTPFYLRGTLPSVKATETDGTGLGGFANVPPGPYELVMRKDGVERGRASVYVRKGTVTSGRIFPRALE